MARVITCVRGVKQVWGCDFAVFEFQAPANQFSKGNNQFPYVTSIIFKHSSRNESLSLVIELNGNQSSGTVMNPR